MKRWTKGAKRGLVEGFSQPLATSSSGSEKGKELNEKARYVARYKELCRIFTQLTTKAAQDDGAFQLAKSMGYKGLEGVDAIFESKEIEKPSTALTSCVVKNTLLTRVSKVTKKKTATSLDFDNHVTEPVGRMDDVLEIGEKGSDDVVIRGLKVKENSKVKSGKRLKGGLEQAVSKRKPKNNKSSSSSHNQSGVEICGNIIHNSNLGTSGLSAESLVPQSLRPTMFSFPQVSQLVNPHISGPSHSPVMQNSNLGTSGLTTESLVPQSLRPTMFSFPQVSQLVNPHIYGPSHYYSPYVLNSQPSSTSMVGLLQTQMLHGQGPGLRSEHHVNDKDNPSSLK